MDDLISRQALCEYALNQKDKSVTPNDIMRFPSAQPQRKMGKWIDGQCSICGCDIPAYIIDWKWQKDMDAKFCPNCGCRMEGESE